MYYYPYFPHLLHDLGEAMYKRSSLMSLKSSFVKSGAVKDIFYLMACMTFCLFSIFIPLYIQFVTGISTKVD